MGSARVRRTLDRLAYASLVLDVCIAIVTALSFFDLGNGQSLLVPIGYLLTIVVVLSVIMFIVLLLLRAKERQAVKTTERFGPGK
jgi:ABC-type transport system involved in multi-copper enzyme maturation permease subunit